MPWIKKSRELRKQPGTPPAAKFAATRSQSGRSNSTPLPVFFDAAHQSGAARMHDHARNVR
jgi:hypothetical protein